MDKEHIIEIKEAVSEAIQAKVNGKIDRMNDKIENYIKADMEWKQRAEPTLKMGENLNGFGKVTLYMLGFLASVAGAIALIIKLFK